VIKIDLLIIDSHPVQYRAPVYREIARLLAERGRCLHVIYGSDSSVRGAHDVEFGQVVTWDEPMLDGYDSEFLPGAAACAPGGFRDIDGAGVEARIRALRPRAILLNGINYRLYVRAMLAAGRAGIPLWLRSETQDDAFARAAWKSVLRGAIYRLAYAAIARFFPIGEANTAHYRAHGVPARKLTPARYCVVDRFTDEPQEKAARGRRKRAELGVPADRTLVMFSGKLIPKKNPEVLFDALDRLPAEQRAEFALLFVGSGEQEAALRARAAMRPEVPVIFAGFVNQGAIADFYLASDGLILPSRQMGETWGLVANEALLAGKPVILSRHAGSSRDFSRLPAVRVVEPEPGEVAAALGWLRTAASGEAVRESVADYSVEAAARAIASMV
jgi:glycosyltransferase involved in cell wall biosynthesis